MKNKILIATIIIVIVGVFLIVLKGTVSNKMVSPSLNLIPKQLASPLPSPTPVSHIPAQYNFDASTDLKKELESINPQILDSDF